MLELLFYCHIVLVGQTFSHLLNFLIMNFPSFNFIFYYDFNLFIAYL
jgi:hypothetical protein